MVGSRSKSGLDEYQSSRCSGGVDHQAEVSLHFWWDGTAVGFRF